MTTPADALEEKIAKALCRNHGSSHGWETHIEEARLILFSIDSSGTHVVVPLEEDEAQLNAARDWAIAKYGQGIGNDGASGCYRAMISARPKVTP